MIYVIDVLENSPSIKARYYINCSLVINTTYFLAVRLKMGVWWILVTLTLTIAAVQSEPRDESSSLLTDRINSLERDLLKLSDQVSMNQIENLRMGLSHYYCFYYFL